MAQPTIVLRSVKGEALTWAESDANFSNLAAAAIPTGGTANQVLTKISETDYDLQFADPTGITSIEEDTSPALGGALDVNGNIITDSDSTQGVINLQQSLANNSFAQLRVGRLTDESRTAVGLKAIEGGNISSLFVGGNAIDIDTPGTLSLLSDTQINLQTDVGAQLYLTNLNGAGPLSKLAVLAEGTVSGEISLHYDQTALTSTAIVTADIISLTGGVKINNLTYPAADGTNGQVLATDGAGVLNWVTGGGGLTALVDDTAPQLGGDLDVDGKSIFGNNVEIESNNPDTTQFPRARTRVRTQFNNNDPEANFAQSTMDSRDGQTITVKGATYDSLGQVVLDGSISIISNGFIDVNTTNTLNLAANTLNLNYLTFPAADGTPGQVLSTDGGAVLGWIDVSGGGLTALVDDTAPQLGGDLDVNGNVFFGSFVTLESENPDTTQFPLARTRVRTQFNNNDPEANFAETTINSRDGQIITVKGDTYDSVGNVVLGGSIALDGNVLINNLTYPAADGTSGQVLSTDGAGVLSWSTVGGGGGLTALVDDITPQLGGILDTNGHAIEGYTTTITGSNSVVLQGGAADSIALGGGTINIKANSDNTKIALQESSGFGYITLTANGEITLAGGSIKLNNLTYPAADGTADQVLTTNGAGVLSWSTVSISTALNDLTDVIITTATTNDVLLYNGTDWVNSPVLGDIQTALTEIIG